MPVFSESEFGRLDWVLMRDGPVRLYNDGAVFDSDLAELAGFGYVVHQFDCTSWADDAAMHNDFKTRLSFPDYYGKNLDALLDCLRDARPDLPVGTVLGFRDFDAVSRDTGPVRDSLAWHLLDIASTASWLRSLCGDRLLVLVQAAAGWIAEPFGAHHATLNNTEWMMAFRATIRRPPSKG